MIIYNFHRVNTIPHSSIATESDALIQNGDYLFYKDTGRCVEACTEIQGRRRKNYSDWRNFIVVRPSIRNDIDDNTPV